MLNSRKNGGLSFLGDAATPFQAYTWSNPPDHGESPPFSHLDTCTLELEHLKSQTKDEKKTLN